MGRAHLVVPEGPQQQQRSHVRLDRQITEQVQGRRVQPLQIVQEQRQRMLRPGEHAEQAAEHQLETALCVLRRQLRHGWLRADQWLQRGDEVDHELAVRAQCLPQRRAPRAKLGVAFAEQRADQTLQRLGKRRIGDVALVLVELAGGEQAAGRYQHLVQLVDDRRLADAGIAGHQHEFRRAALDHAVEGGEERSDLALAAV